VAIGVPDRRARLAGGDGGEREPVNGQVVTHRLIVADVGQVEAPPRVTLGERDVLQVRGGRVDHGNRAEREPDCIDREQLGLVSAVVVQPEQIVAPRIPGNPGRLGEVEG
jgi:hypothetical protein